MTRTWTRSELFEAVDRWVKIHGELPKGDHWKQSGGDEHPTYQVIWARFGSWDTFLSKYRKHSKAWDREKIISAFQEWYEIYGFPPAVHNTRSEAGIWLPTLSTVIRHFGSWNNAIEAAGFTPLQRGLTRGSLEKFLPMPKK